MTSRSRLARAHWGEFCACSNAWARSSWRNWLSIGISSRPIGRLVAFCGEARDLSGRIPRRQVLAHARTMAKKCARGWLTTGNRADQDVCGPALPQSVVALAPHQKEEAA